MTGINPRRGERAATVINPRRGALISTVIPGADTRHRALSLTVIHSFITARFLGHGYPSPCAHLDGDPLFTPARFLGTGPRRGHPSPRAHLDGDPHFLPGAGPRSPARRRALTSTAIHTFYPGAGPRSWIPVAARSPRRRSTLFTPARVLGHLPRRRALSATGFTQSSAPS